MAWVVGEDEREDGEASSTYIVGSRSASSIVAVPPQETSEYSGKKYMNMFF